MSVGSPRSPHVQVGRNLTKEAWTSAMRVLDALPDSASPARIRFVLAFAYSTGLRHAELCGTFTDDISVRYAGAERGSIHLLRVVGKVAKERFVPLVPAVPTALGDYLDARGFPRDPLACPVGPQSFRRCPTSATLAASAVKRHER
jgi:site-specific recombinase XerD